jgi:hypothetical protein
MWNPPIALTPEEHTIAARVLCQKGLPFCLIETQTAQGTAAGNAPQTLTECPKHTMSTPSCGLSVSQNSHFAKRFAEIVRKTCREERGTEAFHAHT